MTVAQGTSGHAAARERSQAPARSRVIASLRHRNYRLFFFGQLVSVIGTWMQTIAQSFLVARDA